MSAQTLNTRFYRELANWFFWSTKIVEFPAAVRARENEATDKAKKEAFEAQNQSTRPVKAAAATAPAV
ncbi:hypothetical protein [Rhizobium sp. 007]|uniref:hypothetical protein n=1 Tax=Rhizobium sp. 007 TaxID=2785056 RepID=UPI0018900DD0|nr:hypothetical protein [Rhizobium sp. 007]QPB19263.1 hypothetical protein ISN39_17035 [Rhizobium sp. 007]